MNSKYEKMTTGAALTFTSASPMSILTTSIACSPCLLGTFIFLFFFWFTVTYAMHTTCCMAIPFTASVGLNINEK